MNSRHKSEAKKRNAGVLKQTAFRGKYAAFRGVIRGTNHEFPIYRELEPYPLEDSEYVKIVRKDGYDSYLSAKDEADIIADRIENQVCYFFRRKNSRQVLDIHNVTRNHLSYNSYVTYLGLVYSGGRTSVVYTEVPEEEDTGMPPEDAVFKLYSSVKRYR